MSISTYATSYSEVVGVALTGDIEWMSPVNAIHKDGAIFIQTAAMTKEFMSGDINDGQALQLGDYLENTLAITQALQSEFTSSVTRYGSLTTTYSDILGDPTVPGTVKALIGIKNLEVGKRVAKLNSGISAATRVISLHKALVKEIGDFAKSTEDFEFG